ncbi:MAG: hypothetical protein LLF89_09210 [Spirochaetaceae bacterium]|nr:hypothetical protein [Spirochaetaceae bacterium]
MNNDIVTVRTRTQIKQNVGELLDAKFSLAKGSDGQWFRQIKVGPWTPGNKVRPAATVVDFGGSKDDKNDSDTTKGRTLKLHVVLDLVDQFDRENKAADWSDRVEQIALAIQNYRAGAGVTRMDYVNDDPFEVLLVGGASEQIWVIEFEADYFVEVPAFI